MKNAPHQPLPPKRWALWLGGLLLIPLSGACAALVYFGLYRSIVTGTMTVTSRRWGGSSSVVSFADSPIWFVIAWILMALMTAGIVFLTVIMARLLYSRSRAAR